MVTAKNLQDCSVSATHQKRLTRWPTFIGTSRISHLYKQDFLQHVHWSKCISTAALNFVMSVVSAACIVYKLRNDTMRSSDCRLCWELWMLNIRTSSLTDNGPVHRDTNYDNKIVQILHTNTCTIFSKPDWELRCTSVVLKFKINDRLGDSSIRHQIPAVPTGISAAVQESDKSQTPSRSGIYQWHDHKHCHDLYTLLSSYPKHDLIFWLNVKKNKFNIECVHQFLYTFLFLIWLDIYNANNLAFSNFLTIEYYTVKLCYLEMIETEIISLNKWKFDLNVKFKYYF